MYIESLRLRNVRTFVDETVNFVHPDQTFRPQSRTTENGTPRLPKPKLPNVNLLLGDNGSGKSTVLRTIAMAALGPSFADTKLPISELVRRVPGEMYWNAKTEGAHFEADFLLHDQDLASENRLRSAFSLSRRGELERVKFGLERYDELERASFDGEDPVWRPVYESRNSVNPNWQCSHRVPQSLIISKVGT